LNCDLDLEVRVPQASDSDGEYVNEMSSKYNDRIRSYGPDKQRHHLTFDPRMRVPKAVCYTPTNDGACVYLMSSNYLEQIKSYGMDKPRPYLTVDQVIVRKLPRLHLTVDLAIWLPCFDK
jgi:hypothetical protein